MDNLPKKDQNDWLSYTGVYPEDSQKNPTGMGGLVENSSNQVSPPVSEAQPADPIGLTQPLNPTGPEDTNPNLSAGLPPETNPFVISTGETSPPPVAGKGKSIFKRLFIFLILIIFVGSLGYAAFKLSSKYYSKDQKVVLTYWGLWENDEIIKPLIEEYKKTHSQVEIVYSQQTHKDYRERLQNSIEKGTGPDIFRFHSTWVPMFKNNLAPSGKTGWQQKEFQETFYPVASQDLIINGKIYGVPLMIDGLGLYYNEDLLRSAGVTPPTTWDEFKTAATALTVRSGSGQILTAGAALGTTNNVEHYSDIVALLCLQNGADLKNPTSERAQEALIYYKSFAEKPNNSWDETLDNSILAFAGNRVAMIFAPSWQVFYIRELNPQLKFQVIPVPQLTNGNTTWASYWAEGVSGKSKYPNEAWEFLKFISQKESMITLYTEESKIRAFGEPYSRVDLAQTIISDPYVGAYVSQAQTAKSFFLSSRTHDNGINDRMIKYLEDAINKMNQGVSVKEALDTAAKGFAQVLSSFGYTAAR